LTLASLYRHRRFCPHPKRIAGSHRNDPENDGRRVIVIFGSAGLRDKEKRRMMAEVAAQWRTSAS